MRKASTILGNEMNVTKKGPNNSVLITSDHSSAEFNKSIPSFDELEEKVHPGGDVAVENTDGTD